MPAALAAPAPATNAERRLTSVLFADLVSYTQLSEARDSEEVRDLLSSYFDVCSTVVKRHGGTIEKFIGDAVMAVWGVPTAYEDDAQRAVRAALDLVSGVTALGRRVGVPDLALRAGVVTGEVAANLAATDQGMVAGDPVNTAARVQAAAAPGEVWVDATTRALTSFTVEYTGVGEHPLKGKAEPVPLFRAEALTAGRIERMDGLEAPLTGREHELRLLKELFHVTEESGRSRLVVLDGEAGVGKTRLAAELEKYVDALSTEVRWHRGRCPSYGDCVALGALADAVRMRLGLDPDTDPVGDDVMDQLLAAFVDDPAERAWLLPCLSGLLWECHQEIPREEFFAGWTRFFERVGGGRPVVLVIDDGQYADEGVLDYVEHLVATARTGVLVLLLARPELIERRPDLGGRRASVIRLQPLGEPSMAELVDGLVEGLPADARDALVARSDGLPLYAVETVRALIDRDLVQPVGGRYVVAPGADLDLSSVAAPASLHALVAARLDALAPAERRVVCDACVLGKVFWPDEIALDEPELDQLLASLVRKEIFAVMGDVRRPRYRFVQTVVQQVAYATMTRRARKVRHLRAADHLAAQTERAEDLAVVIAQHLVDAVEMSAPTDTDVAEIEQRASGLLITAADRACSLGSFADGLRLYQAAFARLADDSRTTELRERAAEAALVLNQNERADELARTALGARDDAGDAVGAAVAAAVLAETGLRRGDAGGTIEFARPRYDALKSMPGSEPARLRLALPLGRAYDNLGEYTESWQLHTEALWLAERLGRRRQLARAMTSMACWQMTHGSTRVAFAVYHDIIEFSRQHNLWAELAQAYNHIGCFRRAYTSAEGVQNFERAIEEARDHGELAFADFVTGNFAVGLWIAGDWDRLAGVLEEFVANQTDRGRGAYLILSAVDRWRVRAGLQRLIRTDPQFESDMLNARAWDRHRQLLDALQDGGPVADLARSTVELAISDSALQDDFMILWPRSVRAALTVGDLDTAEDLLNKVGTASPGAVTPVLQAHLAILGAALAIARGEAAETVETGLRAGVDGFTAYGSPIWLAEAEEDLGSWLAGQGRYREAQPHLDAARATYLSLGATAWLKRLDDRLPAQAL